MSNLERTNITRTVLILAPYPPSPLRPRLFGFARALARRGHRVIVVAASMWQRWTGEVLPERSKLSELGIELHLVQHKPWTAIGDRIWLLLDPHIPLRASYSYSPSLRMKATELIAACKPDLVHIENMRAAVSAPNVGPIPVVYDAIDSLSLMWERLRVSGAHYERAISYFELPRIRAFEQILLDRYKHVLVTSPIDAEQLRGLSSGASITVVPNPVAVPLPKELPRPPTSLVFVGIMRNPNNSRAVVHLVRHVMPLVWAKMPNVTLAIVGSSPPPSVTALSGDSRIMVTGFVSDPRDYVTKAALSVSPTLAGSGIQNKIIESLAVGRAVIASPLAASPFRRYGLGSEDGLVEAGTPGEMASAIVRLLSDPVSLKELGNRARTAAERVFGESSVTSQLLDAYQIASHETW